MWLLSFAAAGVITMVPDLAAASDDPLSEPLCAISAWFSGGTGKAIATVAIIFLGIAAFFGKVTWGLALMFAVGIFAIFGSADIVAAISDEGDVACESGGGTE
jgi:type IV secretory pathway VirB2 component (pilin)